MLCPHRQFTTQNRVKMRLSPFSHLVAAVAGAGRRAGKAAAAVVAGGGRGPWPPPALPWGRRLLLLLRQAPLAVRRLAAVVGHRPHQPLAGSCAAAWRLLVGRGFHRRGKLPPAGTPQCRGHPARRRRSLQRVCVERPEAFSFPVPSPVRTEPTHPVRQTITRHREMCGNLSVAPAVHDPALQHRAIIRGQVPEEQAKPIRCSVHRGDLGKQGRGHLSLTERC